MLNKNEQINRLNKLNEDLENYFSNTIIPQLFIDANLILRKFTPPAMRQFKLEEEHIGRPLSEVAHNFRFPTFQDNIETVIARGEILEKEIQTTDLKWFQMNILPYRVRKTGTTNGVIITFVNITERIRDLKELEKLIAEHELLLDTLAHDIKNPLLALGMTIELWKRSPEKSMERFPVIIKNVDDSLKQLKKVVTDLVETRWEGHRYEATEELVDLDNIIEDVRLALASQIQTAHATITVELDVTEISFTRRKLRSMIYNLVNNALKYRSKDRQSQILIRSCSDDGRIVISVTDNGNGIEPDEQESIFKKHYRADDQSEGFGVGLYLVKEIVESSKGTIKVDSEPGKGSTFYVYLPASDKPA